MIWVKMVSPTYDELQEIAEIAKLPMEFLSASYDNEENADLLEDAIIENNQAIEMCSIYRGIISGMQDVCASIISNNLNIVMKSLAVITIVLSIPTIIASFYGMNFDNIPLDDYQYGFYIIVGASIIILLICAIIVIVYSKNIRIRKK